MNREGALLVMIAVAVAPPGARGIRVATTIAAGCRDRRALRRGAGCRCVQTATSGFYVATTRHGDALERLAIRGLGFRSRVDVTVTDRGVALDLVGQPRMFVATASIDSVGWPPRPSTASSSRAASSASRGAPSAPRNVRNGRQLPPPQDQSAQGTGRCDHRHPAAPPRDRSDLHTFDGKRRMTFLLDPAVLVLEDGSRHPGRAYGARAPPLGEVVFSTG